MTYGLLQKRYSKENRLHMGYYRRGIVKKTDYIWVIKEEV